MEVLKKEEAELEQLDEAQSKEEELVERFKEEVAESESKGSVFGKVFLFSMLVAILIFVFWVQIATEANLFLIVLGFSPLLLSIILAVVLIDLHGKSAAPYLWVLGVFLVIGFHFFLSSAESPLLKQLEVNELTALNVIGIVLFLGLVSMAWSREALFPKKRREKKKILVEAAHPAKLEEEWHSPDSPAFIRTMQSVEDKCKAINFAIGRVYSGKHGGTREMREKIRIPAELYNSFSSTTSSSSEDREKLLHILRKIRKRLLLLEKEEKEVLGSSIVTLKHIKRDEDGESKVIDILAENDSDPVRSYYETALSFVENSISSLEKSIPG